MQNDVDVGAYTFADAEVTGELFAKGFKNNKIFTLPLADIPPTALIRPVNEDTLTLYTDKIMKYRFYLRAAITADYTNLLTEITRTIRILGQEYNVR